MPYMCVMTCNLSVYPTHPGDGLGCSQSIFMCRSLASQCLLGTRHGISGIQATCLSHKIDFENFCLKVRHQATTPWRRRGRWATTLASFELVQSGMSFPSAFGCKVFEKLDSLVN